MPDGSVPAQKKRSVDREIFSRLGTEMSVPVFSGIGSAAAMSAPAQLGSRSQREGSGLACDVANEVCFVLTVGRAVGVEYFMEPDGGLAIDVRVLP